jgi:lipopolysaccharide transport system ATP-binding protein
MQEIWALRDVDLEVERGDSIGVIGRNGGGKSTLLQILTGVLAPTAGEVEVNGRVSALLELGSGFNPEYTGRDNVVLNGLMLGLPRREILARFDEIADFAEIGDAIDRPVKTYSSGMLMRLAFAVQVLTDPDILIVDEALSVGDFFFQQKCYARIRALCERGVTLVFVSHDMAAVRDLCKRAVLLREGRVRYCGDNLEAVRLYMAAGEDAPAERAPANRADPSSAPQLRIDSPLWTAEIEVPERWDAKGRLLAVGVSDSSGRPALTTRIGSDIVFRILYRSHGEECLHVSIVLRNRYDQIVTSIGSFHLGSGAPVLRPHQDALFEATVCPMLEAGSYSFTVSLGQSEGAGSGGTLIDETPMLGPIQVTWDYHAEVPPFYGMVGLKTVARFIVAEA